MSDTNSIENSYSSFTKLEIGNYDFSRKYVTFCDMIKVEEDKKIYFAAVSVEKTILLYCTDLPSFSLPQNVFTPLSLH